MPATTAPGSQGQPYTQAHAEAAEDWLRARHGQGLGSFPRSGHHCRVGAVNTPASCAQGSSVGCARKQIPLGFRLSWFMLQLYNAKITEQLRCFHKGKDKGDWYLSCGHLALLQSAPELRH